MAAAFREQDEKKMKSPRPRTPVRAFGGNPSLGWQMMRPLYQILERIVRQTDVESRFWLLQRVPQHKAGLREAEDVSRLKFLNQDSLDLSIVDINMLPEGIQ